MTNTQKLTGIADFAVTLDPGLTQSSAPPDWSNFTGIQGAPRVMQIGRTAFVLAVEQTNKGWAICPAFSFTTSDVVAVLLRPHAPILLQPLQFFSHFDLPVPGVFVEGVAFAGEDQQCVRNAERIERVF